MLLYPTDVSLEQQFYSQRNFKITDVAVSLVEFEISFKQVFFLQLLGEKLTEQFKPLSQIIEHAMSKQDV